MCGYGIYRLQPCPRAGSTRSASSAPTERHIPSERSVSPIDPAGHLLEKIPLPKFQLSRSGYIVDMLNSLPELNADQRRALELLSDAGQHGCTGATLLAHGFSIGTLAHLIRDGFASAHREPLMTMGQRQI